MVRFKNRYLLVEVAWVDKPADGANEAGLHQAIRESVQANYGNMGAGSLLSSLQVKYYNPLARLAIVRCDRDASEQVWLSISLIDTVLLRRVRMKLVHVGGTSASCRQEAQAMCEALKVPHHLQATAAAQLERLSVADL